MVFHIEMLECFAVDDFQSILLYGRSGSGKTTICKQLINALFLRHNDIRFLLVGQDYDGNYECYGLTSIDFDIPTITNFIKAPGPKCIILDDFMSFDLQSKNNMNFIKNLLSTCRKNSIQCYIIICSHYLGSCKPFRMMCTHYVILTRDSDSKKLMNDLGAARKYIQTNLNQYEFIHIKAGSEPQKLKLRL